MLRVSARTARTALVAGVLAPALAAVAAAAAPASATAIGPNQYFVGDVNGRVTGPVAILVGCFGPIFPGETGHPLGGQYVEVLPPVTSSGNVGYTGSAGDAVQVSIIIPDGPIVQVVPIGTVTSYATRLAISTKLNLPCTGSGTALFDPTPTSKTAKAATLTVDFVGQP